MALTIDEAIAQAERIAEGQEKSAELSPFNHAKERISKSAAEHRQLAAWLKELKQYKEIVKRIYTETTNDHYGNALTALDNIDKILEETRCLWDKES